MTQPTREQCLKWVKESGLRSFDGEWFYCGTPSNPTPELPAIEALVQRVWNEAIEAAANNAAMQKGEKDEKS